MTLVSTASGYPNNLQTHRPVLRPACPRGAPPRGLRDKLWGLCLARSCAPDDKSPSALHRGLCAPRSHPRKTTSREVQATYVPLPSRMHSIDCASNVTSREESGLPLARLLVQCPSQQSPFRCPASLESCCKGVGVWVGHDGRASRNETIFALSLAQLGIEAVAVQNGHHSQSSIVVAQRQRWKLMAVIPSVVLS